MALLSLLGCQSPQKTESVFSPEAQESWREDREQLTKLHRSGVCELRWTDEAGRRHFEPQVDCDLWWQPPSAFALQFSKLGETLGWVGGDGTQLWLFDLLSEPTQLTIIEPQAAANTLIFGLPLAGLLDGWQLQPLPAVGPRSPECVQSRLGLAKLFATQAGSPPSRLATVDGQLEVLYSDWNVIDRAKDDADGRSAGQWFPERVEWRLQAPEATATFWLRQPRRALEQQRWNRLFNLSRLRRSLRPQKTSVIPEGLDPAGSAKTAGS
ncbi:MAG: hypothetical protein CL822_02995 [Crocinitomicaceae bacterium]|nr:hypothetical protein [Crocinitomicaceae bacterium]